MGTSSGWRDVYDKELAYQWVDVSETAPGTYVVGSEADPENRIWEGGGGAEVNPPAFASTVVTVPGWTAQPVAVAQSPGAQCACICRTTPYDDGVIGGEDGVGDGVRRCF
jgi:hypothetical protein